MKLFLALVLVSSSIPAFANYFDLARSQAQQKAAQDAQRLEQARAQAIQNFNNNITGIVSSFARRHGGFIYGSEPQMNDLIPGQIWRYVFGTKDGYECLSMSNLMAQEGKNNAFRLDCINNRTGQNIHSTH